MSDERARIAFPDSHLRARRFAHLPTSGDGPGVDPTLTLGYEAAHSNDLGDDEPTLPDCAPALDAELLALACGFGTTASIDDATTPIGRNTPEAWAMEALRAAMALT